MRSFREQSYGMRNFKVLIWSTQTCGERIWDELSFRVRCCSVLCFKGLFRIVISKYCLRSISFRNMSHVLSITSIEEWIAVVKSAGSHLLVVLPRET